MLGPPLLPRNLEASVRDLGSARVATRVAATEDLVRHARTSDRVRTRAIELFVERLKDPEPAVRAAVAVALGDLDATEAVTALLITVEDDDAHVRQMALNALGEIEDARALPRLRRALEDERAEVRYQAVIAFARVADAQNDIVASEVDDALFAATSDKDDAITHIALRVAEERLDHGHAPDGRLVARARALVGDDVTSPHVRLVAAILLAKAGDERGNEIVLEVVRGERLGGLAPDKEDERAAVELAGELGLRAAVPFLERRVWGVKRFVRDTCVFHARIALARMGHDRATKELLAELASPRREVLAAAVVAAGRARLVEARQRIAKLGPDVIDQTLVTEALALLDAADR
jgi:HEAT repeat protein